jgi:hypothetical protein
MKDAIYHAISEDGINFERYTEEVNKIGFSNFDLDRFGSPGAVTNHPLILRKDLQHALKKSSGANLEGYNNL